MTKGRLVCRRRRNASFSPNFDKLSSTIEDANDKSIIFSEETTSKIRENA